MSPEQHQLQSGIQSLESQRGVLGDAVVDMAVATLKAKLAALTAAPLASEPAQALRQVSILFLDVVGSTTLSQRLDPEAISAVMDGALAHVIEEARASQANAPAPVDESMDEVSEEQADV